MQEHVGKYNVVSELANARSVLTFRQFNRGDTEGEMKEMKCLLTRIGSLSADFLGISTLFRDVYVLLESKFV